MKRYNMCYLGQICRLIFIAETASSNGAICDEFSELYFM